MDATIVAALIAALTTLISLWITRWTMAMNKKLEDYRSYNLKLKREILARIYVEEEACTELERRSDTAARQWKVLIRDRAEKRHLMRPSLSKADVEL